MSDLYNSDKILERLLNNVPSKYRKDTGSFVNDVEMPIAVEFENAYSYADAELAKKFISTASGSDLDTAMKDYGFTRKQPTYAYGYVVLTGGIGAKVNYGDKVAAGGLIYIIQESMEFTSDTVTVRVRSEYAGADYNIQAGEIDCFPVTLADITSVTNPEAFSGGSDEETDNDFRERFWAAMANPRTSGNKYHYEQWAMEIDGVGTAKSYPRWNGVNTIKVVITAADNLPAGDELISRVRENIENNRPPGADVTIVSAATVPITVSGKVICGASYSLKAITSDIADRLIDYLSEVSRGSGTRVVRYAKVFSIVMSIAGVEDFLGCAVNGDESNISLDDEEIAVLGGVEVEQAD